MVVIKRTHQDPTGAGRGGEEYEAATRFSPSTHSNMSVLFLKDIIIQTIDISAFGRLVSQISAI